MSIHLRSKAVINFKNRAGLLAVVSLFVFSAVVVPLGIGLPASAANESLSKPINKTAIVGQSIPITDIQVGGSGDEDVSVTVYASSGQFSHENSPATVTSNGSATIFSGPRSDVNATLATLVYNSDGLGDATVTVELGNNVGNVIHNDGVDGNGHAYIIVDDEMTWQQAVDAAGTYTYDGQTGYLATITSAQEGAFLWDHLRGNGWIGGSDAAAEGDWRWVTGPEAGTQFWSGNGSTGSAIDGVYSHWDSQEPNNSQGDEDCALFWEDTGWNDLSCNSLKPLVVEFGGYGPLTQTGETFNISTVRELVSVNTCEQLAAIGDDKVAAEIKLTADIDCQGQKIEPLFVDNAFMGLLNGDGHSISNFVIDGNVDGPVGLISGVDSAEIKDLTVKNARVSGSSYSVGGLIGMSRSSKYSNVVTDVVVNAPEGGNVGGLIGESSNDSIHQTASLGKVKGGDNTGGLVGSLACGDISEGRGIERSFSTASVSGGENVGGLVGGIFGSECASSYITDSYAQGSVAGDVLVGGLVGYHETGSITNAYSTGSVKGSDFSGGLVGDIGWSSINTASFWSQELSTVDDSAGGVSKTAQHMRDVETYTTELNSASWNFETIWLMKDGNYPCLQWYPTCPVQPLSENDDDRDGVSGEVEGLAPNNGDGNGDGVSDDEQPNVASLISPVSGKYVTLSVDESCNLSGVSITPSSDNASQDSSYVYSSGFVKFTAAGCDDNEANVKIYYHDISSISPVVRKYNPNNNTYFTIDGASVSTAPTPLTAVLVEYKVTDNGDLDINPIFGVITDPVGLGSSVGVPNTGLKQLNVMTYIIAVVAGLVLVVGWFVMTRKKTQKISLGLKK